MLYRLSVCLLSMFLLISKTYAGSSESVCHPAYNPQLPQYLIGYGSLMETASKNKTDSASGENKPVIIDHFKRGWFAKGTPIGLSTTFLGATQDPKAHFNGTIFSVALPDQIKDYDKREIFYCRVAIPASSIHRLDKEALPKAEFWIYEIKPAFMAVPSEKYPIVESYVDIFLSGCLEIEQKFHLQKFADACVSTTTNWSRHWVNDRIYPRRPFIYQPNASTIDQLLYKREPTLYKQIKLQS